MTAPADPAEDLQRRAAAALSAFVDVTFDTDGSIRFDHSGALCSLRAVTLAPGLDVLSLTSVLAWDRPDSATLDARVAERNADLQFGAINVIRQPDGADVVLRYTFPAGGLDDDALTTMLALVLAGVESSRQGLVP
jgi:hypothetical protein